MNIDPTQVTELEFESISHYCSSWAEWLVEFTFEGKRMAGYLFACPNVPESFHADMIEDCVEV